MGRKTKNGFPTAWRSRQIARAKMEKVLGYKLSADTIVHHKDKNPFNNDLENLEIMANKEHSKLHLKNLWETMYLDEIYSGDIKSLFVKLKKELKDLYEYLDSMAPPKEPERR